MWSLSKFFGDDLLLEIVDIGVSMADRPNYQDLIDAGRARLTGFDADAAECRRLGELFGPPHRFLTVALGDGGDAVFRETDDPVTGSLFEPNRPLLDRFWEMDFRTVAEHRIKTTRLDDVAGLDDVDLIKIDVQGAELDIFRNAPSVLEQAVVIQTEVSFLEMYKGMPLFADIDSFLRRSGFQYHTRLGVGRRPFGELRSPKHPTRFFNQDLWADVIYVKDWMRLELLSVGKLAKMAVILHDVFASYDLAHVLLVEIDRREGSNLARRYRKRLERDHLVERRESDGGSPDAANPLLVEAADGLRVALPKVLDSISTYVLLEQERWFEREVGFVERYLQPGMVAVDIGANMGLYSLPMARAVGSGGSRVFAYEPGSDTRRYLAQSMAANGISNITLSPAALSDQVGRGQLKLGDWSELNSLVAAGETGKFPVEEVEVSTLDAERERQGWQALDMVKIDAEGQEARIIAGATGVLKDFSPLVMYEIRNEDARSNDTLRWLFRTLGYDTYRLGGDADYLYPLVSGEDPDPFELNLFAVKPGRAAELAGRRLLVDSVVPHELTPAERDQAIAAYLRRAYIAAFGITADDVSACPFGEALVAYSAYLDVSSLDLNRRHAALVYAHEVLAGYCAGESDAAALVMLGRTADELGNGSEAFETLRRVVTLESVEIQHPFFPVAQRFDDLGVEETGLTPAEWFLRGAHEQVELVRAHSSFFAADVRRLAWLCESDIASDELRRRLVLVGLNRGLRAADLEPHRQYLAQRQRCNREFWQRSLDELFRDFAKW
jgi:FkbM family methyltransferase